MEPFTRLTGIAAPLLEDNVDTDIIFPARFLLITSRAGLGRHAFNDRRFDPGDAERPEFILNRTPWRTAHILIAGANFGCGSSREHAVWTLADFGIRCVIAPSFGEIFHGNCLRNGVLPITLDAKTVATLVESAGAGTPFAIDLDAQTISIEGGRSVAFAIADEHKQALLNGWDETALILNLRSDDIVAFEHRHRASQPWLFATEPAA